MVQHHTNSCTSNSMLATLKECSNAKDIIDPSAGAVQNEDHSGAPKGCSRHNDQWYFNTHETGALDGESEPICKATAGQISELT